MLSSLPEELVVQIITYCLEDLPEPNTLFYYSEGYLAPWVPLRYVSKQFQRCTQQVLLNLEKIYHYSGSLDWVAQRSIRDVYLTNSALVFCEKSADEQYQSYEMISEPGVNICTSMLMDGSKIVGITDAQNHIRYCAEVPGIYTLEIDKGRVSALITLNLKQKIVSIVSFKKCWELPIGDIHLTQYAIVSFDHLARELFRCNKLPSLHSLLSDLAHNRPTLLNKPIHECTLSIAVATFKHRLLSKQTSLIEEETLTRMSQLGYMPGVGKSTGVLLIARQLRANRANAVSDHAPVPGVFVLARKEHIASWKLNQSELPQVRALTRDELGLNSAPPNLESVTLINRRNVERQHEFIFNRRACCHLNRSLASNKCCCRCEMCSLHPSLEDRIRAEKERKEATRAKRSNHGASRRGGNRNRR